MARWASTEPAAPRVVPSPEKNMEGGGAMEDSWVAHCEDSVEISGLSFGSLEAGARRESVWTADMEGRERSVERMCEPCGCWSVLWLVKTACWGG